MKRLLLILCATTSLHAEPTAWILLGDVMDRMTKAAALDAEIEKRSEGLIKIELLLKNGLTIDPFCGFNRAQIASLPSLELELAELKLKHPKAEHSKFERYVEHVRSLVKMHNEFVASPPKVEVEGLAEAITAIKANLAKLKAQRDALLNPMLPTR